MKGPRILRHVAGLALLGLLLLPLAGVALAQGGYDLSWWTVDSGGGRSSADGSYTLIGTLGQPDAGGMSGGNFTLYGGFWPGGAAAVPEHKIYLPLVIRNQ